MEAEQKVEFEKCKALIREIKIASLVTHTDSHGFKGRPMNTAEVDEEGAIWFFTNEFTEKVEEIQSNNDVLLCYTSLPANAYVMVNGNAEVVNDQAKMKTLWSTPLKAWFPEGLDDPKLRLLKVQPAEVEYWNSNSNKVIFAFKLLKAIIKGETFKDGEHNKINIQ